MYFRSKMYMYMILPYRESGKRMEERGENKQISKIKTNYLLNIIMQRY